MCVMWNGGLVFVWVDSSEEASTNGGMSVNMCIGRRGGVGVTTGPTAVMGGTRLVGRDILSHLSGDRLRLLCYFQAVC